MSAQRFRSTLQLNGRTAAGISDAADVVESLGGGSHTDRSTVGAAGGELLVGVSAEHRAAAGMAAGVEDVRRRS